MEQKREKSAFVAVSESESERTPKSTSATTLRYYCCYNSFLYVYFYFYGIMFYEALQRARSHERETKSGGSNAVL